MAAPPGERRLVDLTRFALSEPPDDTGFAKMHPTDEERTNYDNVLRLKREEPSSPLLVKLRRKLDQLEETSVTFDEKEFVTSTANGTSVKKYQVEKELDGELVLLEEGDAPIERRRSIISFVSDDELVLTTGSTRVPMVRARPGQARRPTEAPSSPTPGELQSSQRPVGGGPPALEACQKRYFACVDAMPPEARQAMGPSLDQVRALFDLARSGKTDAGSVTSSCQDVVSMLQSAGYCARQ